MVIKSLSISNFLSYHGESKIIFDIGPTIIIGQNNTGKSKLFDAFNWVLFNKAFKTQEERWEETKEWRSSIVNSLAKKECKVNGKVKCSVCLRFTDDNDTSYQITREYEIKKNSGSNWDCPKSTTLFLTKVDPITKNTEELFNHEAEDILKSIFPENLSKYFLFQGENISQIMSLGRKSDFTKALRDLSRIEVFELTKYYTQRVFNRLNREYEEIEDSDEKLQIEKKRQRIEITELEERVSDIEDTIANLIKEKEIAKQIFDKKKEELSKYSECATILRDIRQNNQLLDAKRSSKSVYISNNRENIINRWMYSGTDKLFESYLEIYSDNKVNQKIPEPIRQEFLKEMLKEYKCLICGRKVNEDSQEYKTIQSFLNDKALDKEVELINQISFVVESQLQTNSMIRKELEEYYIQIERFDEDIKSYARKISNLNEELLNIKPSDITTDEIKKKNLSLLQESYDNAKTQLDELQSDLDHNKGIESRLKEELEKQRVDFNKLIDSSDHSVERERLKLANKLNESAKNFYDTFYNKLISDIEKEANSYFQQMTNKNPALSGKVVVNKESNEVYTVDENERRLQNINQANKVSLQISFVAAILSVSNKFWNTSFPFIADAPISALGGSNKITAVETIMEIFRQSVLILKDDAELTDSQDIQQDAVRKLINSDNTIKNAYELRMTGATLEQQHTRIFNL